jgi:hypothetical protein
VPTVFLSYRHEDEAHVVRVRDLAQQLEATGLEVVLDQFAQAREFRGGGPDEGWPRWSKAQAENPAHKVLIVASGGWFRCYRGTEVPGKGLGASAEAGIIEQRLYNSAGVNPDVRMVTLAPLDPLAVPLDLQRYHRFRHPEDTGDLISWLTAAPGADPAPMIAWPERAPSMLWPMANHGPVRDAFERLLTSGAPWRFLPVCGPTEVGKTHITLQMLGNALRLPDLACGRLDFKGTTDVELELRAFVQHLDLPSLPAGSSLGERLGHVLDMLRRRARPALLMFDTYEAAGEAEDWVEKHLLPVLIRSSWLRVVIAGQRVPERAVSPWASESSPPLRLASPAPEDWFSFAKGHKPDVTLEFVRQAHQFSRGKASVLAQLLGPAT